MVVGGEVVILDNKLDEEVVERNKLLKMFVVGIVVGVVLVVGRVC